MTGGDVIRRARRRAGLSRTALARLLATTEEQIARWEDGPDEPTFADVDLAARVTGAQLVDVLAEPDLDPHDASLLDTTLALTVDGRLRRLIAHARFVRAGRDAVSSSR